MSSLMEKPKVSEGASFGKLPKWAQSEVKSLERQVERLEAELRTMLKPNVELEKGAPIVGDYSGRVGLGLPCYRVGWHGTGLFARAMGDEVELSTGDGQPICVIPSVSNVIRVRRMEPIR